MSFVRLAKATHFGDLTEVPIPTRFLFILLGQLEFVSREAGMLGAEHSTKMRKSFIDIFVGFYVLIQEKLNPNCLILFSWADQFVCLWL